MFAYYHISTLNLGLAKKRRPIENSVNCLNINKVHGCTCLPGYLLDVFLQILRGLRGQLTLIMQNEDPAGYLRDSQPGPFYLFQRF